jgi:hypothetical protein
LEDGTQDFGLTKESPIRVGGGLLFGPFNERQYLARLRGLAGSEVEFERLGSFEHGEEGAERRALDAYEVKCEEYAFQVQLFFDVYTRGPLGAPPLFEIASEPALVLPKTVVKRFRVDGDPAPRGRPRRWRILASKGGAIGFGRWDGEKLPTIDPPHLSDMLSERLEHFCGLCPADQFEEVLEDFFERYLLLESSGAVRGEAISDASPSPTSGHVWSADVESRPGGATRLWSVVAAAIVLVAILLFAVSR